MASRRGDPRVARRSDDRAPARSSATSCSRWSSTPRSPASGPTGSTSTTWPRGIATSWLPGIRTCSPTEDGARRPARGLGAAQGGGEEPPLRPRRASRRCRPWPGDQDHRSVPLAPGAARPAHRAGRRRHARRRQILALVARAQAGGVDAEQAVRDAVRDSGADVRAAETRRRSLVGMSEPPYDPYRQQRPYDPARSIRSTTRAARSRGPRTRSRTHSRSTGRRIAPTIETRRDVEAALAARDELGADYDDAIASGLAERVEQLVGVPHRRAAARPSGRPSEDRDDGEG